MSGDVLSQAEVESLLTAMDGRIPDLAVNPEVVPRWRGRRGD